MSCQQRLDPPRPVQDQFLDGWLRTLLSARFDLPPEERLPDRLLSLLDEVSARA